MPHLEFGQIYRTNMMYNVYDNVSNTNFGSIVSVLEKGDLFIPLKVLDKQSFTMFVSILTIKEPVLIGKILVIQDDILTKVS